MTIRRLAFVLLVVFMPAFAHAQDFGVMESAETINRGNFKLKANPMFVMGRDDADNETGITLGAGYGFTDNFDAEAKLAFYDGLTFFGGDVEFWVLKNQPLDVSVGAGFHVGNHEFDLDDSSGFDVTVIASAPIAPKLELYGALDLAFNHLTDDAFEDADDTGFTTVHLVPGIEYALTRDLDLLAEFGIALNDDSSHYFSIGIAYYIR